MRGRVLQGDSGMKRGEEEEEEEGKKRVRVDKGRAQAMLPNLEMEC